jgi:excisionase family DNA binding protein
MGDGDYITVREAAARKGVSVPAIYRAIERGALPSAHVLGRVALRPADVDAYEPGSYGGKTRARRKRGPTKGAKSARAARPPGDPPATP